MAARNAAAQEPTAVEKTPGNTGRESPWLVVPLVSSSPKLGTAGGGLGGYMHTFDPESRLSMFGAAFMYTSTESKVAALFARTSFGADHHRLDVIGGFGYIRNDYQDYLGTGQPLKTNDDAGAFAVRYRYRVAGNWFVGGQGSAVNYQVLGDRALDDELLDTLGVTGFNAAGVGANLSHDSRDNQDMPFSGWFANVNNLAYREWLGGENAFDVYRVDFRSFTRHGGSHVLAIRQNNEFTVDAPISGQASVLLRGYKQGEYIRRYMSSGEVEERLRFSERWGATVFAGVAAVYGERDTTEAAASEDTYYPSFGGGVHFIIKPQQRVIANLEYAYGNSTNSSLYLKLGYAW